MIELKDIWDFHTDIRTLVLPEYEGQNWRAEQLDLATCQKIGGVFSATCRWENENKEDQWKILEKEVDGILSLEGLTQVLKSSDVEGTGRQLLHAEGIYFIQETNDISKLEEMWELGFRSLAPLYNTDNALGGGAKGCSDRGLTTLGREFCIEAWTKGFMLDCAHCNQKTIKDILNLALNFGQTINYTHGFLDLPANEYFGERGIPRTMVKDIASTGGLMGLSPHPGFYGTFERFMDDVAFLAINAPSHGVLGSDFTGITKPPIPFEEFPSESYTPKIGEKIAMEHGEKFARDFCGRAIKEMLQNLLPK